MGVWGTKPFCNDSILDDIGGFTHPLRIKSVLERALDSVYYYGYYEIGALLASTYEMGLAKQYVVTTEKAKNILSTIGRDTISDDEYHLFHESSESWVSACTLDLVDRQRLITRCMDSLTKTINNTKTGKESINRNELITNMKDVFNILKEIVDSNYARPILITENLYDKLNNAYNKQELIRFGDKDLEVLSAGCGEFRIADRYKHRAKLNEQEFINLVKAGRIPRPNEHDGIMYHALIKYFEPVKPVAQAICTDKVYKGNKITHYQLQDSHGRAAYVEAETLKDAMKNHGFLVKNLKITSDGRIITVK